jgi:2-oxoglutarate dehydrogenase E1 component
MSGETHFQRYIPDPHPDNLVPADQIKRHILCSGQLYYQLLQEREKRGITDVVISRVEQLSPLPYDLLTPHLDQYPNSEVIWAQEEPLNNGAWSYVQPRLITAMKQTEHHKGQVPIYAGRKPSSSVATGNKHSHKAEVELINEMAFTATE